MCNEDGNVYDRAYTMTAAIPLIVAGYLAMAGVSADPAKAQSSGQTAGTGWTTQTAGTGWTTQVVPGSSDNPVSSSDNPVSSNSVDVRSGAQYLGAAPNDKQAGAEEKSSSVVAVKGDGLFRSGPQYGTVYESDDQIDIYGAKKAVEPPRPPIEVGRQQYTSGNYDQESTILGQLNPSQFGLAIYGDWRTAVAYNNNNGKDIAQIATRLNIDVDLKLTGTERIHAFFTPIQNGGQFTRFEFGGSDGDGKFTDEYDFNPQTLFFEGDFGSLFAGFSGQEASFDLPFTVGLFPLFLQNGIWANDAILGAAVSLPAKNSAALGLSNFDITFFAAFDNVNNNGILGQENHNANIYGVTTFVDAFDGYVEAGYGLIQGVDDDVDGQLTHFVTAAYSRRYYNTLSNSTRVFANFGNGEEDDGVAIISENSLISGLPSTLLPYANFFVGFGNPQSLVDGNGAGILKNVGINFETDALTGFPKLNDSGSNAFGGAIGLQYLFNLDQQILFELAMVQPFGEQIVGVGAAEAQYAMGVRYQVPINKAWLFRADATYQILEGEDEDNFGVRGEIRRKF